MQLHYKGVAQSTDRHGRRHLLDRAKLPGKRYVYRHSTLDTRFLTVSIRYGAAANSTPCANECEAVQLAMQTPKHTSWPWSAKRS